MQVLEVKEHKILVDDVDWDLISRYNWYISCPWAVNYAFRTSDGKAMHTVLMGTNAGLLIDHRDRNGLNNQRSNLRWATPFQNALNRGPNSGFKYKGVAKYKNGFRACYLADEGKVTKSGFKTEEDAARYYDKMMSFHWGDWAYLNFPR